MSRRFELHFELEPRCPLDCLHCSSQAMRRETRQYADSQILALARSIPAPLEICFTGGEPLLYPRLASLLCQLSAQVPDCRLGLFTTGLVPGTSGPKALEPSALEALREAGLGFCYLSLYSHRAEEHDAMTRQPGSFQASCTAIRRMVELGVDTRINLVVTRFNRDSLLRIAELAAGLGAGELRLLKLVRHGSAVEHWSEIGLTEAEYRTAAAALWQQRGELPLRLSLSSLPELAPCRPIEGARGCQAGLALLYVALSGDVFPCACVKTKPEQALFSLARPDCFPLGPDASDLSRFRPSCLAGDPR